jgi:hypothetical protein
MKTYITKVTGSEDDNEGSVMVVEAMSPSRAALAMIRKCGWDKPDQLIQHGKVFIPAFSPFSRAELIDDHESGNAGGIFVEELKLSKLY